MHSASEIAEKVRSEGIYIFDEPFVTELELSQLLPVAERECSKADDEYKFGKAARVGALEDWVGTPIGNLFSSSFVREISHEFFGFPPSFSEIFITNEYRNDKGLERNGWLHFDRIPTLKFFIYLNDCIKDTGAFSYVPGSHILGKELREKTETNPYEDIKNRLELDYPELGYKTENATSIEGKAGTMFVFHTDLFHCGGRVKDKTQRKAMRLHLRP